MSIPAGKSTIESKVEVTTKKVCSTLQAERRVNPELKDWEIRLFELDVDLVNRLVADGSYIEQLIPADTYCQSKATLTVGVRALLLTKITDNPADRVKLTKQLARVKQLAKSLFTHPKAYERAVRAQIEIERGPDQDPITQDLGKLGLLWMATPEQFHSREIKPQANFRLAWVKAELWLLIGCIVFLLLPVCLFPRRVLPWLASRGEFFAGGLGLLALWTVAAVGMNHKEGNLNEHYANWPNSFLTTLADLTPLFGDHALTTAGQAYLAVCQKFAYVILVAILLPTGHRWLRPPLRKLRARLLELGQKPQEAASRMQSWVLSGARKIRAWLLWLLGLIQKHRPARATSAKQGRSVIINDLPERTEELAHELRNADPRAQPIVVVSQKPPQLPGKPAYQDAQFVHGEPTCEECLQRARVSEADSIRIVSAWPNPNPTDRRRFLRGDLADGRTIQAVRAIHSLCGERKGVKIVVELKLRKNRRAALEAAQGTPITIDVKDDPQSVSA